MAPQSKDPKLIMCVINFELVQPICPRYVNVTDGLLTIAILHFALHALCSINAGLTNPQIIDL